MSPGGVPALPAGWGQRDPHAWVCHCVSVLSLCAASVSPLGAREKWRGNEDRAAGLMLRVALGMLLALSAPVRALGTLEFSLPTIGTKLFLVPSLLLSPTQHRDCCDFAKVTAVAAECCTLRADTASSASQQDGDSHVPRVPPGAGGALCIAALPHTSGCSSSIPRCQHCLGVRGTRRAGHLCYRCLQ